MNPEVTEADWGQVESRPAAYGLLSARRTAQSPEVLLAVDHEARRHVLLLLQEAGSGFRDTVSRGLTVEERLLIVESDEERPFLDLTCMDRSGHQAFNLVVADILGQLADSADSVTAVRATMSRWRHFWGTVPPEGLSPEQIRGLFGELWFLLVWAVPQGLDNVTHWDGPTGTRHDFNWPTFSVEVKTTHSIRGHVHRINGLDQLQSPDSGPLYLFSLQVREEPSGAHSLVTVIDGMVAMLSGSPDLLDDFERRLGQAGYSPMHAPRYAETRFHIVDERLYLVEEHFPRLSAVSFLGGLPHGIERVEYEINLETCLDLCVGRTPTAPGISFDP